MVKVPSTPPAYVDGVVNGIQAIGISMDKVSFFSHGTTVGTNAVLERKGAITGLITTKGFEDVLEVAHETWEVQYDYWWKPPNPLAHRLRRLGVRERVNHLGKVLEPLVEGDLEETIDLLKYRDTESLAVCLLHSYVNPIHERRVRDCIKKAWPELPVYISSEILPEVGEFERASTTVVSAYIGPLMSAYLRQLEEALIAQGYRGDIVVMNSAGGGMTLPSVRDTPARALLSGPAAGAMAGVELSRLTGRENLITLDVGGTSADMALIYKGKARLVPEWSVAFNIPVRMPSVDIHTIGAGGGSVTWVDPGGGLRVGPRSAGASPGPACYGRGGIEPTLTDALLVLGHIIPEVWEEQYDWSLDAGKAAAAINDRIAQSFGMSVDEASSAIREVTLHNLVQGMRLVSVERGYDPRDFGLVAYGGAGPLLAADIARELHIPAVYVPILPGVTSAMGLLQCDLRMDAIRSVLSPGVRLDFAELNSMHNQMIRALLGHFKKQGTAETSVTVTRQVDIRHYGQARYLTLTMPDGELSPKTWEDLLEQFDAAHMREYGYIMPVTLRQRELANLRVVGVVPVERVPFRGLNTDPGRFRHASRKVHAYFRGHGRIESDCIVRSELKPGSRVQGPALIVQPDSTTVVPPGARVEVDESRNLAIHV
jgi:N-methylhydantoinase A